MVETAAVSLAHFPLLLRPPLGPAMVISALTFSAAQPPTGMSGGAAKLAFPGMKKPADEAGSFGGRGVIVVRRRRGGVRSAEGRGQRREHSPCTRPH